MKRIATLLLYVSFTSAALASPLSRHAERALDKELAKPKPAAADIDYQPGVGVLWHTQDGQFSLLSNYIVQLDATWSSHDPVFNNDTNIPLSKIYLSGNFLRAQYTFTYNFAQSTIDQANVGFNWPHFNFQVGQIAPYFGLVNDVADNAYNFIGEPLAVSAFSPNYSQGLALQAYNDHFVDEMNLFGQGSSEPSRKTATLNATMRLLYVPFHQTRKLLHLGLNFWTQTVGGDHIAEFFTMPELLTHSGQTLVKTGTIDNASNYQVIDGELVAQKGSFNMQSETIYTWIKRFDGSPNISFNGFYVLASYFLTGETRVYQYPDGYFTGITPIRHKYGALQLLARYSLINLSDKDIHGGAEHNFTLGLNWYSSPATELSINYIRANANPTYFGSHDIANLYAVRLQLNL